MHSECFHFKLLNTEKVMLAAATGTQKYQIILAFETNLLVPVIQNSS